MAEMTLQEAVKKFAKDLAQQVESFINDVSVLEVRTFTTPTDQMPVLVNSRPDFTNMATEGNVALRAYTKISFDGDTTVCLPLDASGEIDKGVWDLHQLMVHQSMNNRATMLRAVGEAASSALTALKKANE
jgi:hypothetical protein